MKYYKLKYRFIAIWDKGWNKGYFTKKNYTKIKDGATCLNYSQQCFEGMKCVLKNNKIINYYIDKNIIRLQKSMKSIFLPMLNFYYFIKIINYLIFLNNKFIPNYKIGFLYIRPLILGIGNNLGVKPSKSYIIIIYCSPIFYKKNKINSLFSIKKNRAIKNLGNLKIGANYVVNLSNSYNFKKFGFNDIIYINRNIFEEIGTSNLILFKNFSIHTFCNKNILFGINRYYFIKLYKKIYNYNNNIIDFNSISNAKFLISTGTAINIKLYKSLLFKNKILFFKKNFFLCFFNFIFFLFIKKNNV